MLFIKTPFKLSYRIKMKPEMYFDKIPKDDVEAFHKKIASNIQKIRKKKGISQHDLALSMGIESFAFYSNCENLRYGKHFNIEHIFKISQILEVEYRRVFSITLS